MPVVAIVSELDASQQSLLTRRLGSGWTLLDASRDRNRLAREGAEVEIVYGNVRPFELAALPKLRWIHATWSGVENLCYPELIESGVMVTNTRGQSSRQIAEHVAGCLFYMTRDLAAFQRATAQRVWKPEVNLRLIEGSRALVLGMGALGGSVAAKLTSLGARVWGVNTSGAPHEACEATFTFDTVRERLGEVEHIVACLPGTPGVRHQVDDVFLAALKPGATLINVGRGAAVDEAALVKYLKSGRLSGAALDVTDPEPPLDDSPLYDAPNLILTSHMSWFPFAAHTVAWQQFLENLTPFLEGRPGDCVNVVDLKAGY